MPSRGKLVSFNHIFITIGLGALTLELKLSRRADSESLQFRFLCGSGVFVVVGF